MNVWQTIYSRKPLFFALLLFLLCLIFLRRALFLSPDLVLGDGYDMRGAYYLWHQAAHEAVRAGQLPIWDAHLFSGYPFLVNPQVGFFYPPAWLAVILPVQIGISWYAVFHMWVAALGMLLLVRAISQSWLGGVLAGLAFAFSAFMTARIWAGHLVPLATHVWLPWMLLGLWWSVQRRSGWTAVLAAIPFALAILAGHTTSLLYVGLVWGLFALYLLITEPERGLVLRQSIIIGLIALTLSAIQLAPLVEFSLLSTRVAAPSYDFATDFSLPPAHLITILIPDYFGEPVRAGYWSVPTFVELTIYAGVLPILGLLLALRRPSKLAWFYIIVIVMGVLLAIGNYGFLYRIFYDFLPPFRLARAPGRASFLYVFAISALLGEAIGIWQRTAVSENRTTLGNYWRWVLIAGGVAMISALAATGAVFAAQHPTETSGRLWHQVGGWSLALTFFLLGGALLWGFVTTPPSRNRRVYGLALALLILSDLWFFGVKMVQVSPTTPEPFWLQAKAMIGDTHERVLPWGVSLFWQNGPGQVGLYSVFGYNSLETSAFEDFVASVPDPRATTFDILGAAYVVSPVELNDFTDGERPLTLYQQQNGTWVYERGRVLPLARLVYNYEVIADHAAVINRVHAPDYDPETTVILPEDPGCEVGKKRQTAVASITNTRDGYWDIETNSDAPGLLVLSESAYPGWQVTIDGQTADPLTAYSVIRAVCVPAGTHTIKWEFRPSVFKIGGTISLLGLLLVGLALWRVRGNGVME